MTSKPVLIKESILVDQNFSDLNQSIDTAGNLLLENGYIESEYIASMKEKVLEHPYTTYLPGAGSSLMVKNSLIKKAKKAGIEVEIVHSPATQIPADTDIVVTHQGLAGVAKQSAPENAVLIQYLMFMNDPSLNKLIKDLAEGNTITST